MQFVYVCPSYSKIRLDIHINWIHTLYGYGHTNNEQRTPIVNAVRLSTLVNRVKTDGLRCQGYLTIDGALEIGLCHESSEKECKGKGESEENHVFQKSTGTGLVSAIRVPD